MPIAITIPRLGWNMEQGVFVGWLKQDGDTIRAGDPLFTLEGEKATQDIEASDPGILRIPDATPRAGDTVAVGALIGYLLAPGEADPAGLAETTQNGVQREMAGAAAAVSPTAAATEIGTIADADRRDHRNRPRISPLARRVARELGVDWTRLHGSGCTGRIRKVDVLAVARARADRGPALEVASIPGRSLRIGPTRRTIAARMVESCQTTAPVTLNTTADATNLVNLRAQFKAASPPGRVLPGYTDFVVKLTAMALKDHPMLHARWDGDRLVIPEDPHIGIAVDTEEGLLVPVIRGAAGLGLGEIVVRARDLVQRARERRLRADEMQGGTFTITNLGSFGVETFTPIINLPECAILGMGRIVREPVMAGDQVVARERMGLSLTFDHRIVDGAPAARFLQSLVRLIENPGPWLIP
jgi:pyruvate dehydrogenase E2 component (dihydrolipoyllysine-residue acetyltransferase)